MNQLKVGSIIAEAIRIFLPGVIIPFLMAWFFLLVPPLFASEQTDDPANQTLEGKAEQESGGLRYALNSEQRFNIRLDIAWVDDGIGVVVNIREAF